MYIMLFLYYVLVFAGARIEQFYGLLLKILCYLCMLKVVSKKFFKHCDIIIILIYTTL